MCTLQSSASSEHKPSSVTPGVATGPSPNPNGKTVVGKTVDLVKRAYGLSYVAVAALMCGVFASPAMAQTPATFDDVPEFINPAELLGKLVVALGTFIGPVILFLFGIAVIYMFTRWLIGSKRVG